jgi:hypothetical protein
MYIKLPMYLFFYVALGLNDFDAGKSITYHWKGWALKISPFWAHCHFRAQKVLIFQYINSYFVCTEVRNMHSRGENRLQRATHLYMGCYAYVVFPTSNLPSLWIYTALRYTDCGDCDVCTAGHSADRQ